jgi:hypothetical protein
MPWAPPRLPGGGGAFFPDRPRARDDLLGPVALSARGAPRAHRLARHLQATFQEYPRGVGGYDADDHRIGLPRSV